MIELLLAAWLTVADEWTPYNLTPNQLQWFNSARPKRPGPSCCSVADGHPTVWETRNGKYWAAVQGQFVEVPDEALVEGPSPVAVPTVWYRLDDGKPWIRCFWPGAQF